MSAGRPSLYREEYAERVIEFCRDGYTLTAFAGEIGVARSTINEWISAHPEFSEAVSRAKALKARWWEERAREVALKGGQGGQATMIIFGLKNHAPDDFRDKTEHQLTGKDGAPIEHAMLTPEERAARAKQIIEEAFAEVGNG